ncbi:hypothetical protein OG718_03790 [Streptomyces sp. NBC_00258]|nr:hypothetical protein [Streptomyces sp. NBC_00258]
MTAARARTWGRRGQTPLVRVRGRSWRRYSIAALCCYRPGESSRLIYRPRRHPKYRGVGRNSFAWTDYRDLIVRAHILLKAPIVLIWDNLNTRRAAGMRQYAAGHDWLTIVQLPSWFAESAYSASSPSAEASSIRGRSRPGALSLILNVEFGLVRRGCSGV